MASLHLVLLVASFVCFILSALNVPSSPWVNLTAAGLACWVATLIF